jgi:NAD(P)-dependent dehydrogenase (short-subunit alcohol dehydrogenase family)
VSAGSCEGVADARWRSAPRESPGKAAARDLRRRGSVHAVGIAPSSPAEDTSVQLWNRVLSINSLRTLLTNEAAFGPLKDNGGAVINFASVAGITGLRNKSRLRR